LSILTQKKQQQKWFLSSRKYDQGCSSRIPDLDADFLPIPDPDPGVKKAPDPDPQHWLPVKVAQHHNAPSSFW
jgi:hypothetical protein